MEAAISAWDNIYHRMGPINRRLSFPMTLDPRWLVGLQLMPILLGILTNSDRQRNYHDKWWFRSKWLTTVCMASQIKNVFSLEVEVKFSDLSHRMALINHHENIITSLCIAEPNEWQPSNSAANDAHVYLLVPTELCTCDRGKSEYVFHQQRSHRTPVGTSIRSQKIYVQSHSLRFIPVPSITLFSMYFLRSIFLGP